MGLNITPSGSPQPTSSKEIYNVGLTATVAANALTITLTQANGSALTAGTGAAKIGFRNATSATGQYSEISATSAISIVIPSGTTIGTVSGATEYINVYAINNAGTIELAVATNNYLEEGSTLSTTAISGGSNRTIIYSTTSRSNVANRLIGRIKISEATAGTWASSPTEISVMPFADYSSPTVIGTFSSGSGTYNPTAANGRVPKYIVVEMVGAGSGGGGQSGSAGGSGGNTTFSTLTAGGASGSSADRGVGGSNSGTLASAIIIKDLSGGDGGGRQAFLSSTGGDGGVNPLGGNGSGATAGANGSAAKARTGAGGGGGGGSGAAGGGCGGGAGGYLLFQINNPQTTYSYSVGTGGSGGTGTTTGGAGSDGIINIQAYY